MTTAEKILTINSTKNVIKYMIMGYCLNLSGDVCLDVCEKERERVCLREFVSWY